MGSCLTLENNRHMALMIMYTVGVYLIARSIWLNFVQVQ